MIRIIEFINLIMVIIFRSIETKKQAVVFSTAAFAFHSITRHSQMGKGAEQNGSEKDSC